MGLARTHALRGVTFAALLALCACREEDGSRPLDGGYPIDRDRYPAEVEKDLAADPCRRRERGGWHYSVGHCEEMLPGARINGVWVTGFEESSFFPLAAAMPDRNDPRRYRMQLEVDGERVRERAGVQISGPGYHAFALTLLARRTKYPHYIDCYGGRHYTFVAYEVISARYLGTIADPDPPQRAAELPRYTPFRRSGEGGVIAELEERALAHCSGAGLSGSGHGSPRRG